MLPPTYNPNRPNRPKRPRPISAADSAATTGLASNPNGTYVSNPFPTTAQNGAQGAYGAMLPATSVQQPNFFQQLVGYNPNAWNGNDPVAIARQQQQMRNVNAVVRPIQSTFNRLTGQAPWWGATPANSSGSPDDRQAARYGDTPGGETFQPNGSGRSGREYQPGASDTGGDDFYARFRQREEATTNAVLAGLEAGDMSVLSMLPPSDLEAMGLGDLAGVSTGASSSGIGTGLDEGKDMTPNQLEARYFQNQETESKLMAAKRWDAKKKKYVSVGQWMRQEKKKYNRKGRRKQGRREEAAPVEQAQAETQNASPQFTVQTAGNVNFNTATG